MKCIVKDCKNHTNEGGFIGDLCSPCHEFITTGQGVCSQAYRNTKREWAWLTYDEINEIYDEYGQCRKYGYEEAIQDKLKEKNT